MSETAPQDYDNRKSWQRRPGLARAIRIATFVIPVAVAIAATTILGRLFYGHGWPWFARIGWMLLMFVVATIVSNLASKLTQRLVPLSALCQMNLDFPEEAPSRVRTALRMGNTANAERVLEEFRAQGLAPNPQDAALQVLDLIEALNRHDRKTRGHTEKVRAFSEVIAAEMGLSEDERNRLRWASVLHDIGKIAVPAEILNKAGKPNAEEWAKIQSHPLEGLNRMGALRPWLGDAARAVEEHHERWDGTGYPRKLKGEQIALAARIVAVADSFEVMTAARSYKKPMSYEDARSELVKCSGTHFDPAVVRAFLKVGAKETRAIAGFFSSAISQLSSGNGQIANVVQSMSGGVTASTGASVAAPLFRGMQMIAQTTPESAVTFAASGGGTIVSTPTVTTVLSALKATVTTIAVSVSTVTTTVSPTTLPASLAFRDAPVATAPARLVNGKLKAESANPIPLESPNTSVTTALPATTTAQPTATAVSMPPSTSVAAPSPVAPTPMTTPAPVEPEPLIFVDPSAPEPVKPTIAPTTIPRTTPPTTKDSATTTALRTTTTQRPTTTTGAPTTTSTVPPTTSTTPPTTTSPTTTTEEAPVTTEVILPPPSTSGPPVSVQPVVVTVPSTTTTTTTRPTTTTTTTTTSTSTTTTTTAPTTTLAPTTTIAPTTSTAVPTTTTIDSPTTTTIVAVPPGCDETKWKAEYYSGATSVDPVVGQTFLPDCLDSLDYSFATAPPNVADQYAARFSTTFTPASAGPQTFTWVNDGGYRLWIDGEAVAFHTSSQGELPAYNSASVTLSAEAHTAVFDMGDVDTPNNSNSTVRFAFPALSSGPQSPTLVGSPAPTDRMNWCSDRDPDNPWSVVYTEGSSYRTDFSLPGKPWSGKYGPGNGNGADRNEFANGNGNGYYGECHTDPVDDYFSMSASGKPSGITKRRFTSEFMRTLSISATGSFVTVTFDTDDEADIWIDSVHAASAKGHSNGTNSKTTVWVPGHGSNTVDVLVRTNNTQGVAKNTFSFVVVP